MMKTRRIIPFLTALGMVISTGLFAQKGDWNELNLPNSPSARQGHSLVTLPDGRVVLFGGEGPQGDLFNDLYIFEEQDWTEVQPSNNPPPTRSFHNAWISDYEMYVYGGKDVGSVHNDLWVYNVNTHDWQEVPVSGNLPAGRYGSSATVLPDGSVVIFGGKDVNGTRLTDTWKFNNTNFEQLSNCMLDYAYHFGQVIGDAGSPSILFFGIMNILCSYHIGTDQWDLNAFSIPYYGHGSTVTGSNYLDEKIVFIFGGLDGSQQPSDIVYEYNCNTEELIQRQEPLPGAIINGAAAKYFYNKDVFNDEEYEVVIFGGEIDGVVSDATWMSTSNLLDIDPPAGDRDIKINISPNPSSGPINITSTDIIKTLKVYTISGRFVRSYPVNNNIFRVDGSVFENGVYLFRIETEKANSMQKVIIN